MAKQMEDNRTIDMLPMPVKRGRLASGCAMSAAERMRIRRDRDKARLWDSGGDVAFMTVSGLIENLRICVSAGRVDMAREIADELIERTENNARLR